MAAAEAVRGVRAGLMRVPVPPAPARAGPAGTRALPVHGVARVEYKGKVDLATTWLNDLPNTAMLKNGL